MNYGMPYMGSKNKIAEKIINALPRAKHFYDLFGGGGAITHCALLSGKYKYIHYNELDPLVYKGFKMFINGKFKTENRWISREDFLKLKDTDPYVAFCFSFGNDLKTYCYEKNRESFKKAVHYSICFNDNSLLSEYIDLSGFQYSSNNLKERRLQLQRYFSNLLKQHKLSSQVVKYIIAFSGVVRAISQNNQSLDRLNEYNSGNNIILSNQDYSDIEIEPDSVVYCDPPYTGTRKYTIGCFDHNKFYDWCRKQKNVFISEYTMPEDFKVFMEMKKNCTMDRNKVLKTVEKIFVNSNAEIATDLLF